MSNFFRNRNSLKKLPTLKPAAGGGGETFGGFNVFNPGHGIGGNGYHTSVGTFITETADYILGVIFTREKHVYVIRITKATMVVTGATGNCVGVGTASCYLDGGVLHLNDPAGAYCYNYTISTNNIGSNTGTRNTTGTQVTVANLTYNDRVFTSGLWGVANVIEVAYVNVGVQA